MTPVVHGVSSPLTANITNTTSLYCVATGFPRPTISWLKNGDDLTNSQTIQSTTLNATDVIGQSTITPPNGVTVSVDSSLAELLSGNTVPLLEELGSVGLLVFTGVERGDTANYSCVASNMLPLTGPLSDQSNRTELTVQGTHTIIALITFYSPLVQSVLTLFK